MMDRRASDEKTEDDGEGDDGSDSGADHLDDIEDGAGCTEIWERLSERREE